MDLETKIHRAKQAVRSISEHDDASRDEVEAALSQVVNFVADEEENGLAGRDERIEKRAEERNAKSKKAVKDAD